MSQAVENVQNLLPEAVNLIKQHFNVEEKKQRFVRALQLVKQLGLVKANKLIDEVLRDPMSWLVRPDMYFFVAFSMEQLGDELRRFVEWLEDATGVKLHAELYVTTRPVEGMEVKGKIEGITSPTVRLHNFFVESGLADRLKIVYNSPCFAIFFLKEDDMFVKEVYLCICPEPLDP